MLCQETSAKKKEKSFAGFSRARRRKKYFCALVRMTLRREFKSPRPHLFFLFTQATDRARLLYFRSLVSFGFMPGKGLAGKSPRALYAIYYRRLVPNQRLSFETFSRIVGKLRERRHAFNEIKRALHVEGNNVNRIARFLRIDSGSPVANRIRASLHLETRMPEVQQAYNDFRAKNNLSIEAAAKKAGVSLQTARRWDRQRLDEAERKELHGKATSKALSHPKRELIRQMLAFKNRGGTFRYSASGIARAFGVGLHVISAANEAKPAIRDSASRIEVYERFKSMTVFERKLFSDEAKREAQILEQKKEQALQNKQPLNFP